MFPVLVWFCSLPRTGKAIVDDCDLTLQMQWRENARRRGKNQFLVAVCGSKTSLFKFPIEPLHLLSTGGIHQGVLSKLSEDSQSTGIKQ